MKHHMVKIDTSACIGCGMCVKTCVAHNLKLENNKAKTLLDDCVKCGQCAAICPKEAITMTGYDSEAIPNKNDIHLNPDEVLEVIRFRRTIRQFQTKDIPQHVIDQILDAGRLTHTAKNMQDVSFVVLKKDLSRIEQLAVRLFRSVKPFVNKVNKMARNVTIDDNFFFFHAPIVIVVLAKNKTNGLLAAQNMEFVAEAHKLGVLFSGYFSTAANISRKIKKALVVPKGKKVAATLVLGYPSVKFARSAQREDLDATYM